MENWILARDVKGTTVKVRQGESGSKLFIGVDGKMYDISDLDFTQPNTDMQDFIKGLEESNKRFAEQQMEHQELMNKMLASMDANAIADHKAAIDEREYWRKLRGEIFKSILEKYGAENTYKSQLEATEFCVSALYDQDFEFFKDKMMFNLPIK